MSEHGLPHAPIAVADLTGLSEEQEAMLTGWLVVPPEWLEFIDDVPIMKAPLDLDDVRRGLNFLQRSLDEEGWAIGHRGWIVMKHLEVMGREFGEVEGSSDRS